MRIPSLAISILVIVLGATEAANFRGKLRLSVVWSCRSPTVMIAATRQCHQLRHSARNLPRLHEFLGYQAGLESHVQVHEGHIHGRLGLDLVQGPRFMGPAGACVSG